MPQKVCELRSSWLESVIVDWSALVVRSGLLGWMVLSSRLVWLLRTRQLLFTKCSRMVYTDSDHFG